MGLASQWCFRTGTAVLVAILLFVLFAGPPARADTLDPNIQVGYIASLPTLLSPPNDVTVGSLSWNYAYQYQTYGTGYIFYFENNSGQNWTSLQIVATIPSDATSRSYSYASSGTVSPATQAFTTETGPVLDTSTDTVTYNLSGGAGIASGDYLAFYVNNFSGPPGDSTNTTFEFTANPGTLPVPEPSLSLLLGSGALGLGLIRRKLML